MVDRKLMQRIREHQMHANQPPGTLDTWAAERWLEAHGFPADYKNRIDFTLMRHFGLGPKSVRPNNGRRYYYPDDLKRWIRRLDRAVAENLEARRLWARGARERRKQRLQQAVH